MNEVVTSLLRNSGLLKTFNKNDLLVVTPRTRNSRKARINLAEASFLFLALAVILTRSES